MRVPFPERIRLSYAALFSILLMMVQAFQGTPLYFCIGCGLFIVIATLAFNIAGGLSRASGAYVFFYSVLVVIIGLCYKALLGEPADSNLLVPKRTIEIYVAGITAMLAAVIVSGFVRRKSGLLQDFLKEGTMYRSSIGCFIVGIGSGFVFVALGAQHSALARAFGQLNQLIPLGIMIGVMWQIRQSHGLRSMTFAVLLASIYYFVSGMIIFSKEGMLYPLLCWIVPVAAMKARVTALQVGGFLLAALVTFVYLVPYAQYGRSLVTHETTFRERVDLEQQLILHPDETKQNYNDLTEDVHGYFNTSQGLWDRLQFISVDDGLIKLTDDGRVFGLFPIKASLLNIIPHVFWPDKPTLNFGNVYAHEEGGLSPEDNETGISFSPTGEAYHLAKWAGVCFVAPIIWCSFFIIFDSALGDIRATPWGLLALAMISHLAPEGGIEGPIYLATYGLEVLIFCAVFATWVAPLVAALVLPPERRSLQREVARIRPRHMDQE